VRGGEEAQCPKRRGRRAFNLFRLGIRLRTADATQKEKGRTCSQRKKGGKQPRSSKRGRKGRKRQDVEESRLIDFNKDGIKTHRCLFVEREREKRGEKIKLCWKERILR